MADTLGALASLISANSDSSLLADLELRLAAELIKATRTQEAAECLQRATGTASADPTRRRALAEQWLSLARAFRRGGTAAHAESALRTAAELGSVPARVALGQQLAREQRFDDAVVELREAVRMAPDEASTHLQLGRLLEQSGQAEAALAAYLNAVAVAPSMANVLMVAERIDALAAALPPVEPQRRVRIALLGNATLDHLQSYLKVQCYAAGLRASFYQAGFDQYTREIFDPKSGLYAFEPDVVICAIHSSRLFPNLHEYPFDLTVAERRAEMDEGVGIVQQLLDTLTQRTSAMVLLHNMVLPQTPTLGILDARDELGQSAAFAEINTRLAELARGRYRNVYTVDEDRVQARAGKARATDPRTWLTARMPWSEPMLDALSREHLRYIRAARGLSRKCLVLDLDNTLWGGVIGEDGLAGIQLGSEAPGSAFVAFQRELEKLWRRGVLLAICSKNNPEDALRALDDHPDMVLRRSHFAALRINWQPKAANIREIAAELNIGLDSLVFLDDNPVERAVVRAELPGVLTPDLPRDPAEYRAAFLDLLGHFDTLSLTDEDRKRNQLYVEQRARQEAQAAISEGGSLDEYLANLEIVVEIDPVNEVSLPRISQLTGKTNQFNLTTRRYTEAEILAKVDKGAKVFAARVRDRFGDSGLTGVAIVEPSSVDGRSIWTIDTLLLSCRVMGRAVETALLAHMVDEVRREGGTHLQGWYLPTAKNSVVRDIYAQHGFTQVEANEAGQTCWQHDVQWHPALAVPAWLTVRTPAPLTPAS